jgi:hypothetical protein
MKFWPFCLLLATWLLLVGLSSLKYWWHRILEFEE